MRTCILDDFKMSKLYLNSPGKTLSTFKFLSLLNGLYPQHPVLQQLSKGSEHIHFEQCKPMSSLTFRTTCFNLKCFTVYLRKLSFNVFNVCICLLTNRALQIVLFQQKEHNIETQPVFLTYINFRILS